MNKHLLTIDPQNGFAEVVGDPSQPDKLAEVHSKLATGELCVPGGMEALNNIARAIVDNPHALDDWTITYDCHHRLHVAHGIMYKVPEKVDQFVKIDGEDRAVWVEESFLNDPAMKAPAPLTTLKMVNGQIQLGILDGTGLFHFVSNITCSLPGFTPWIEKYLPELEARKRYPHMIWPVHCQIGTRSNNLVDSIRFGRERWERATGGLTNPISKGSNYKVEHFGAVHAEVQDPEDPASTGVNANFVSLMSDPDQLVGLSGLALTHCVANTALDLGAQFPNPEDFFSRLVLITDGTAGIPGLEFLSRAFIDKATPLGMQQMTIKEFLAA